MTIKDIIADVIKNLKPGELDAVDEILAGRDDTLPGADPQSGIKWSDGEKKVKRKLQKSSIEFE